MATLLLQKIYQSNRAGLIALLTQFGAKIIDYGIIKDDVELISNALETANKQCDVVISSGGVSVGDADYVKDVLDNLGHIGFSKIAIKPGKPFAFGKLSQSWFCGLPGNPVSSFVTCQQLVFRLLSAIQNEVLNDTNDFVGEATMDIHKRAGRKDFQRGLYSINENGKILVRANGPQGSGIMTSVANTNCYIVLEKDQGRVSAGEQVKIIPFAHLYT